MVKKKQPDFQKTKLRVGKPLPKGRNVTNTSFKSKKIITKDQKFKTSPDGAPLKDLLALCVHNNVLIKFDGLKNVRKYVEKNSDSLKSYFFDILSTVGKVLLDNSAKVRASAIKLIEKCLDFLSNTQINCFMQTLISHLNCMMTHMNISVKKDSLNLLSVMLRSHPNSICSTRKVLSYLLDMISSRKRQKRNSLSQNKRKLDDTISSDMTAVEWRDRVMTLILEYLETLIDNASQTKKTAEDEQKVYLDRKRLVCVPLYAGGGLTPAKVEFPSSVHVESKMEISQHLKSFLSDLVKVASDIITEELAVSSHCKIFPHETIEHLNTITQVLCCLGQWYRLGFAVSLDEDDPEFLPMMFDMINKKLMYAFPYSLHESTTKKPGLKPKEMLCMHLNLGISYLFCTFILGTELSRPDLEKKVIICLLDALGYGYTLDTESLLFILNTFKLLINDISLCDGDERYKYISAISEVFEAFNDFLINSTDEILKKEVQLFFAEVALNYEYRMFLQCDGMKKWIGFTFSQMNQMIRDKKVDKVVLKCINQMCSREYPTFMFILNQTDPTKILEVLKLNDEDFQFTAMNLITQMGQLPPDFLQNAANFILLEQSVSVTAIVKLIRLLFDRFSNPLVSDGELLQFVRFLLNVAFDLVSVENTTFEVQAMIQNQDSSSINDGGFMLKKHLFDVQEKCMYRILPSMKWKRHSDIFNVCLECLLAYKDREIIMRWTTAFLSELLRDKVALPVHSAIALMEISIQVFSYDDYFFPNKCSQMFSEELLISSLLYISVLTHKVTVDTKLKEFGIAELQKSLYLSREKALRVLELIVHKIFEQGLNEVITLYILRILKFFIARKYVHAEDIYNHAHILHSADCYCTDNSIERAYLTELFEYLHPKVE